MEDDLKKIEKWYELSLNTSGSASPRRGLFSSKCPKCGGSPAFAGAATRRQAQVFSDSPFQPRPFLFFFT